MADIKLDHTSLDTVPFIARSREITTAMASAPAFGALGPKLPPLNTLIDTLEAKHTAASAAEQALSTALTEEEDARNAVEVSLRQLAKSASGESEDAAELQAGGWHLRATRGTPVGPMPAPANVVCTAGDMEGEVDCSFDAVDGRNSYVGEHAISPTGPWTQFYLGKKSSCTSKGLTSGTLYYFRFAAVGTAGQGPWSDPASKRAT